MQKLKWMAFLLALCLLPIAAWGENADFSQAVKTGELYALRLEPDSPTNGDEAKIRLRLQLLLPEGWLTLSEKDLRSDDSFVPYGIISGVKNYREELRPKKVVQSFEWNEKNDPQDWIELCRRYPQWEDTSVTTDDIKSGYGYYNIDYGNVSLPFAGEYQVHIELRGLSKNDAEEELIYASPCLSAVVPAGVTDSSELLIDHLPEDISATENEQAPMDTEMGEDDIALEGEEASDISPEGSEETENAPPLEPSSNGDAPAKPISKLSSKKLYELKVLLCGLGYLPIGYMELPHTDENGQEMYDEGTIAAVKQFQQEQASLGGSVEVTGIANDRLLEAVKQAEPQKDRLYRQVRQSLVALRYLPPEAISLQAQDDISQAVHSFQQEHGIEPTGEIDAALLAALETAVPKPTPVPTPVPTPTPFTLALITQSDTDDAYTQPTDILFTGTAPAGHSLVLYANYSGDGNKRVLLDHTLADESGRWSYTLTKEVLADAFEDRGRVTIEFIDAQDQGQVQNAAIVYNAEGNALPTDLKFLEHQSNLILQGHAQPGTNVQLQGSELRAVSDGNGLFNMTIPNAASQTELTLILDHDEAHPHVVAVEGKRSKALIGFLEPVSNTALVLLLLTFLAALLVLCLLPLVKRHRKPTCPQTAPAFSENLGDGESTLTLPDNGTQKGGSKNA